MALRPGLALASAISPATDGTAAAVGVSSLAARQDHGHALGPLAANVNVNNNAFDNTRRQGYQDVGVDLSVAGSFVRFGDTITWRQTAAIRNVGLDVTRKLVAGPASTSSTTRVTLASLTAPALPAGGGIDIALAYGFSGANAAKVIRILIAGGIDLALDGAAADANPLYGATGHLWHEAVGQSRAWVARSPNAGEAGVQRAEVTEGVSLSGAVVTIDAWVVNALDTVLLRAVRMVAVT